MNEFPCRRFARSCLALMLAATAGLAGAQPADAALTRHLEAVMSFAHGLDKLGPAQRAQLEVLRRDPDATVATMRAHVVPPDPARLGAPGDLHPYARAMALLGLLDHPAAATLLGEWYIALSDPEVATIAAAIRLRRVALDAFVHLPSPAVTEDVMAGIGQMDMATRIVALRYLARTGRGNAAVRERLRTLSRDPGSPLHDDVATKNALRELDGGSP